MSEIDPHPMIGSRIVVTGMAGAGKSTFSRALALKTGLPVIHLDLYSWHPGWVRVPEREFHQQQRILLAAENWIVDSNDVSYDLLVERADTLVVLDTVWWLCAWRAFKRGLHRPRFTQLPDGCDESVRQRLGDEWGIVWRNWRGRQTVRERELSIASQCQAHMKVHVLSSKREVANFLDLVDPVC